MRGSLPELTEVGWRSNESATEVMLPDSVHHHAREQRIGSVGNQVREFQSSAARREERRIAITQRLQVSSRSHLTKILLVPANVDLDVSRLLAVPNRMQEGVLGRQILDGIMQGALKA